MYVCVCMCMFKDVCKRMFVCIFVSVIKIIRLYFNYFRSIIYFCVFLIILFSD
jgi:hypothetical protein